MRERLLKELSNFYVDEGKLTKARISSQDMLYYQHRLDQTLTEADIEFLKKLDNVVIVKDEKTELFNFDQQRLERYNTMKF